MLFIWTSEGGPLQYVGLAIFVFQLASNVLPVFQFDFTFDTVASAVFGLACGIIAAFAWKIRSMGTALVRQRLSELGQLIQTTLQGFRGREWSYYILPAVIGIGLGVAISRGCTVEDIVRWLPQIGQLVTLLSLYRAGRDPPEHAAARQAKMEQMTALVAAMPLEPFLNEDDMDEAPISQLKQMLETRGAKAEELESFVERQDLIDAVKKKRKYSDTCCICFEEYTKDEPLRILPRCCHELHVECLDKWVYTFANNAAKLRQDPTCPLCKEVLK